MVSEASHGWIKTMLVALGAFLLAILLVVVVTNAVVVATTTSSITSAEEAQHYDADAILVLGAAVRPDGTPSNMLRDRLDDGIALYKSGAAPKIIMSGDNGTASYNEVAVMKEYAVEHGVPAEDIFCDHAGFSTYESMYRAKHIFGVERLIVCTQTYHLYRALYAAHGLGMEALGVPCDTIEYSGQFLRDLREVPARTKDFFKTLFQVPSTFVGDAISLHQSGDVTEE